MTDEKYSQGNAISVEDGKIIWIGSINPFQKLNDEIDKVDLKGAYVLPGFFDYENHIYFTDFFDATENDEYIAMQQDDWLENSSEILKDKGVTSLFLPKHTFDKINNTGDEFLIRISNKVDENVLVQIDTYGSNEPFSTFYDRFESVPDAIRSLTTDKQGGQHKLTTGETADFVVFEGNPFQYNLKYFANMHCIRIVKNGRTIYNMDEEAENQFFDLLMSQTF